MEHTSDIVYDGKLLHEVAYPQRAEKYTEVELSIQWCGCTLIGKIDFYDKNEKIIHETKRGNKIEEAHEWQLKYYIWLLEQNGIADVQGKIEYPKLRRTTTVVLSNTEKKRLEQVISNIQMILRSEVCPPNLQSKICRSCSYYDFCYSGEL